MSHQPKVVRIAPTAAHPVPAWQQLPLTLRGYRVRHDVSASVHSLLGVHLDTVNAAGAHFADSADEFLSAWELLPKRA